MVKGNAVVTVGRDGIECGIGSTSGSKGITLNAWNLNQTADGVAGDAEVLLKSHRGRLCYLVGTASP